MKGRSFDGKKPEHIVEECERFFRSDWFSTLAPNTDPEKIMKAARTQAKYEEWRKAHKCGRCRLNQCIHRSGTKWYLDKFICQKEGVKDSARKKL